MSAVVAVALSSARSWLSQFPTLETASDETQQFPAPCFHLFQYLHSKSLFLPMSHLGVKTDDAHFQDNGPLLRHGELIPTFILRPVQSTTSARPPDIFDLEPRWSRAFGPAHSSSSSALHLDEFVWMPRCSHLMRCISPLYKMSKRARPCQPVYRCYLLHLIGPSLSESQS